MNIIDCARTMVELRSFRYEKREGIRLLSLDWDAWTGDRNNNRCCGYCKKTPLRIGRGVKRKGDIYNFWEDPCRYLELNIGSPIALMVSECHADLGYLLCQSDFIINVDYHDDGSNHGYLCCGSWACGQQHFFNFDVATANSYLKCNNFAPDFVYMCLSSPWTPKLADQNFFEFVYTISQKCQQKEPVFFGHKKDLLKKKYLDIVKQN